MPLAAGQTLTHYELLGPLGAGGMGEVWRARDTRLGREVAVKVLPEPFADDEERLRRFEREARTLASLNHPNVAGIHGIDQVGDTCFLAMELVPGEDLEERLARGPLPVDEALDVCRQIAEGLEAAHEAGVVHRDLKPANVRVTPEGVVKLLDFGLAKPTVAPIGSGAAPETSSARPDSFLVTSEGMILGTPTYMSPEQARGKPVDRRADVWAFGCVLYECLTGRRAFDGEAFGDLVAAILEREPDLDALPRTTPAHVRELVRRALVKDPRQRLRDVGEARIALESGGRHVEPEPAGERFPAWTLGSAALGLSALGLFVGYRLGAREAQTEHASPSNFRTVTDQEDLEQRPSLSPDGRQVVYEARSGHTWDVWSQRVGGARAQNLTADLPGDQRHPALSPDGEQIVFRSEHDGGGLFVMGATGESPRRVTDFGFTPCWSPDGTRIAFASETTQHPLARGGTSALFVADVASGEVRRIDVEDAMDPAWSPDGRWIAYWSARSGGQRDLHLVSSEGGVPMDLTDDPPTDWCPAWSADGNALYFSSDRGGEMSLWSLAIDAETGRPRGTPRPLVGGVGRTAAHPSPSRDGSRLAFTSSADEFYLARVPFDPERREILGSPERIPGTRGGRNPRISPDGEWIVFQRVGAQEDLFLIRPDGSDRRQITDDVHKDRCPSWSPDGERIFFHSDRAGAYEVWSSAPDGSDLVRHTLGGAICPVVAPDGERLALAHRDGQVGFLDLGASAEPREPTWAAPHPEDGVRLMTWDWSPDGRWVLAIAREGRESEAGLTLLSADGHTYDAILTEVNFGSWSHDGRAIVFTDTRGALGVWDVETSERSELLSLSGRTFVGVTPAPDGHWLYLEVWAATADLWVASLVDEPEG